MAEWMNLPVRVRTSRQKANFTSVYFYLHCQEKVPLMLRSSLLTPNNMNRKALHRREPFTGGNPSQGEPFTGGNHKARVMRLNRLESLSLGAQIRHSFFKIPQH